MILLCEDPETRMMMIVMTRMIDKLGQFQVPRAAGTGRTAGVSLSDSDRYFNYPSHISCTSTTGESELERACASSQSESVRPAAHP